MIAITLLGSGRTKLDKFLRNQKRDTCLTEGNIYQYQKLCSLLQIENLDSVKSTTRDEKIHLIFSIH
jgi:hypothetical protein